MRFGPENDGKIIIFTQFVFPQIISYINKI